MKWAVIGGTFDTLHLGHKKFIQKAFKVGDRVLICLTSDEFVKNKPLAKEIANFKMRKQRLEEYLKVQDFLKRAEIVKINDAFTEGLRPNLNYIVVTKATRKNAELINKLRKERKLKPLKIVQIKLVLAANGKPISDLRIRRGEIDKEGKTLKYK